MMNVINIRDACLNIVKQYVDLRNKYVNQLNTKRVNLDETLAWLKNENVIVIGLEEKKELLGVGIIYRNKGNEVSYFVKFFRKGLGARIIENIENIANANNINKLWARVNIDNIASIKLLKKTEWKFQKKEKQILYFEKIF